MRTLRLAIVAAMAIHSTAYAQMETRPTAADRALTSLMHSPIPGMGPKTGDRIVRNPNECTPDAAEAVWDANVLGYSCRTANAN